MSGTALVTGGGRGIGAATAVALAEDGWDVALTWQRRQDAAARTAAACSALGVRAVAIECEVADPASIVAAFARADELGPLELVVNNAGIVPAAGRLADYDVARLDRILAVNVRGAFLVAQQAVRRMSRGLGGSGGVIVNVSSRAAQLGSGGEYVDYAASKAAIDALTVGLAAEVAAEGIRVVGVRPGLIDTELHASGRLERLGTTPLLGRPGTAAEVAASIAWLASSKASYITGTSIDVSGGR